MVGLVPTIHLSTCSGAGAGGGLDPRDKPEDDKMLSVSEAADETHQSALDIDLIGAEDTRLVVGIGGF
jgi:hypothetical protein